MSEEIFQIAHETLQQMWFDEKVEEREKKIKEIFKKTFGTSPDRVYSYGRKFYAEKIITENFPTELYVLANKLGRYNTDTQATLSKIVLTVEENYYDVDEKIWDNTDIEPQYGEGIEKVKYIISRAWTLEKAEDEKSRNIIAQLDIIIMGKRPLSVDC